ncbi:MAG: FUSC family protein [Flavonifractor plautii]
MKSVPLPRIGMRVVKTAVAVMLSYTIFVPFGLIYNEALGGVWGQLGPLYACIACIICTQSTLGQTIQQGLSRLIGVAVGGALGTATLLLGAALDDPWVRIPALGAVCVAGCGSACCSSGPPPVAWRASCPASFSSPASPA